MGILSILVHLAALCAISPLEVRQDLDAHPWRPVPAAPATAESTTRTAPVPASAPPAPTPVSTGKSAPTPGAWQLQLGALASPEAAGSEKKRLEQVLGAGSVQILLEGNIRKLRYGRFGSRAEADSAGGVLKAKGIAAFATTQP
jgi:cell division septation protein DedD